MYFTVAGGRRGKGYNDTLGKGGERETEKKS